ncbi:spore germination protein D [Evansella caseinilytica]|uniref:Spore germination protein D n=1 Tax=Evansella caseinilytica TaxID=1503961 RepID=A0A1H3SHL7_9BACI|nr:spore germination lipoprotein GerD [Evansella caseinilytica]SDZ37506.1 spore germination protein D [Evansella caseinilytica]
MWQLKYKVKLSICMILIILITGCAAMEDQSQQPDYENTKKMMVDMLKTDEGKQAIQDVLKDEEVKKALVMDQDYVKDTIRSTLTSDAGKEYWQKVMKDPEFSKAFAESLQNENEKVLKGLMKDPEYQGMMITVLKDPEMEKEYLELMQSKAYRQQVMTIMTEALESPLFVGKLNEIIASVAEKQMQKKEEEKEGQSGGGSESSS